MDRDKNLIIEDDQMINLTPSEHVSTEGQVEMENPVILIESDETEEGNPRKNKGSHKRVVYYLLGSLLFLALMAVGGYAGSRYYRHNYYVGMPVSASTGENIRKLQAVARKVKPEVILTQDSIGTVALNIYELRGLKAELSFTEPDSMDTDVYFYSRCADYDQKGRIMGSMVMKGKEVSKGNIRLGYCAMAGENTVIGIARSEAVRDYVQEQGGSFFRQFILVSDGEMPRFFYLHGKVERRALARIDDQLYYVESRHAETMYDFADVLRRYGFIDAIYITGGKCHSYYRTVDGTAHNIGLPKSIGAKHVPWLVFRKR